MVAWATAGLRMQLSALVVASALLLLPQQPGYAAEPTARASQVDQQALIAEMLASVHPSDGTPRLYFVGFAGYGPEAVFKREVIAVRKLFDERFGTKARSVALINHASTAEELPLASADNLERVLRHLGKVMHPERDTLFLFLTSHGDPKVFAVEMPGVRLEHLTPGKLRDVLDASGIQKRIVVLSSCFSGSFIPALAGPNTLVITAARGDRPSFGCSDKRVWTYFGDAYFNRALRRETSFKKAFHRAEQLVKRWERAQRLQPSLPQMSGGEALGLE